MADLELFILDNILCVNDENMHDHKDICEEWIYNMVCQKIKPTEKWEDEDY